MTEGLLLSGRYRLVRQLGSGGMGSVWLARDLNLQVDVAIKLIDPSVAESHEAVGRFQLEARAAAAIRSTHVVQILDHGIDKDRPFIAMELLNGENLGQRLERVGRLLPLQAGFILGQVGRALTLAHNWGIVHRDLKPDNVYLVVEGEDEVAKVLDFGIARRMGTLSEPTQSKTRTGAMLGTPYYMSPEQATGQPVDHLSDIWSFGVIAFECLTGQRAFEGESVGALFHSICMQPLPVPSAIASVPPGFDEWFARAVARDKEKRFSTIKEASESLRRLCGCTHSFASSSQPNLGQGTLISSERALTTTGIAAVSSRRSRRSLFATTVGRVRRRPYLSSGIALSAITVFTLMVTLVRDKAAKVDRESPRVMARAEASSESPVATSVTPTVASVVPVPPMPLGSQITEVTSVTPPSSAAPRFYAPKVQKTFIPKKSKNTVNHRDDNAAGI
jgi:serine/threonine-protein kinase